ncbi:MAG: GNAT family N-acetyltransferase [Thermoplasmata archaeon]|nr:GNAT family N-acetyltransferase [Thermoplasmata archaeon]
MFPPIKVTLRDGRVATIRRARATDAEAVIAQVNEIGGEGVFIHTEKLDVTLAAERAILRKADGRSRLFVVGVIEGRLVASADIARGRLSKNRHTATLGIAIGKEARGGGLGTAMMNAMIGWAKSVGIRKLTLVVFATNRPALALYRKLGFVAEGRLRGQVILRGRPVDELPMALWL